MPVRVAWWNLENLFDHQNAQRPAELAQRLGRELNGWTVAVRNQKLDQLAAIVRQMFNGAGPDLLGICEVENERVAEMLAGRLNLPGRNYQVLHHASPDARGIDVSLVYDQALLQAANPDHQVVVKRTATRDIFWADFTVRATQATFATIANHWPSRSGGHYESQPYRMLTGETVSYVIQGLFDQFNLGNELPVLIMGDFNDQPYDRSMQEYLLGTRDPGRVRRARTPRLLNLMWPLMSQQNPGTYRYQSESNMLDQFLVSRGMLSQQSAVRVRANSVQVFRPAGMVGTGGAPRRFGRPSQQSSFDQNGFSDHFPITVILDDV